MLPENRSKTFEPQQTNSQEDQDREAPLHSKTVEKQSLPGSNKNVVNGESPRGFALLKPYFDNKSRGKATFTTKPETSGHVSRRSQEHEESKRISDSYIFSEQEESKEDVQSRKESSSLDEESEAS